MQANNTLDPTAFQMVPAYSRQHLMAVSQIVADTLPYYGGQSNNVCPRRACQGWGIWLRAAIVSTLVP
jgi:hypothetical protein